MCYHIENSVEYTTVYKCFITFYAIIKNGKNRLTGFLNNYINNYYVYLYMRRYLIYT